jgi:ATP-binding cassette subfamily B multidrug efflux pump
LFPIAVYRFLIPYLREERRLLLLGIGLILGSSLLQVSIPRLVGEAIGRLESGEGTDLVPWLALAMVGAMAGRGVTSFLTRRTVIGASRRIEYRLRNRLFRHLEGLDSQYFASMHTGDLMSRFTSDIDAIRMVLGPALMYSVQTTFTLCLAGGMMLSISPALTVYSLVPLALLTVAIRVIGPRVHRESMRAQERLADISVHAQENFSNARVVRAFVVEDREAERMARLGDEYFEQNMVIARLRALSGALLWLFGDLALISLIAFGGTRIIEGEIDLGEFASFQGYQLMLVWPMIALGWVMNLFQRGGASAGRIRDVLDVASRVDDREAVTGREVIRGTVSFDQVSFAYADGPPVLDGISFDLRAGGTLGVIGPTGSGKSSLLTLVPRLAPNSSGTVLIDGERIETFPLERLREQIGLVSQEPFLFSATIAENIAFGAPDADPEEIERVARLVRIHDEIENFPHGYRQRVGERGITLSGGQKQRIALARAILARPRILLLDDVLSAVDADTEAHIIAGLREWTTDLSTIIVSHRLSAVRHADEILVLDRGRVEARGTHASLMGEGGRYARLYRRQTLEAELEDL